MKKIILLFILFPLINFAQTNWHPIPDNQTSYYSYGYYYFHVYTMKTDSVIDVDTGQYYYNVKNPELVQGFEEYGYYDPYSSWLGKEVFVNDTIVRFYDNFGGDFTINFARQTSEPWIFYTKDNGSYAEAHVKALDFIPILEGLPDSVKYITFEFYSKNGERLQEASYNDTLVLSKNYGLINTPRFNNFNFSEPFNYLIGIESNGQLFGWKYHFNEYVANYQIGDEIHQTNGDEDYIEVIIGIEQNDNFVDYEIQKCNDNGEIEVFIRRFYKNIYPGQSVFVEEGSDRHARHRIFYSPTTWEGYHQHIFQFYHKYSDAEYEGQYVWHKNVDEGSTGIYPPLLACNELNVSVHERGADEQWHIDFFQNDSFTYGTPYSFNCVVNSLNYELESITVSPNPNRGVFNISNPLGLDIVELRIVNVQGDMVWQAKEWDKKQINISGLKSGLYFLQIHSKNRPTGIEKLMIQD